MLYSRLERLASQCSVYDDVIAAAVHVTVDASSGTSATLRETLTMAALEDQLSHWHTALERQGEALVRHCLSRYDSLRLCCQAASA